MENFLSKMLAEVSKQQQILEVECGLLQVLLRPWPTKKEVLDDSEDKNTATTQEIQKVSDNLSKEEKQALSQVDKLLQKAEKTRRLKLKVKQDEVGTTNIDAGHTEKIVINSTESSDCPVCSDTPASSMSKDIKENSNRATTPCVPLPKTQKASKQTSGIQSLQPENRMERRQLTSNNKNRSATTEVNKDSRQKMQRPPSSSSSKSSSGKPRHIPAHVLAPFKTQENLKFPKHRKSNLSNHTSTTITAAKAPAIKEMATKKILPNIASTDSKRLSESSDIFINSLDHINNSQINSTEVISPASHFISGKCDFSKEELLVEPLPKKMSTEESEANGCSVSNLKSRCSNSTKCVSVDCSSLIMDQQHEAKRETHSDLPKSGLQQFNLTENGSSIKLPSRLVKLVNTNRTLRNRLAPSGQVKAVPATDPARQFLERLSAEEEICNELSLHTSALTCLKSHQILLDIVQGLKLDQLSEKSSMQNLYRAKRTLEFVLTTFSDLQEQADYFSQLKYRQLPPALDLQEIEDQDVAFWSDLGQQKGYEDDLWNHLQTSKRWAHLDFTEKYLRLNIALVKFAQAEWWKIISQDRSPAVLQGVFGLLTSHGQFLPALVENPDLA